MINGPYLQPVGLVYGQAAHRLVGEGAALWLAGGPAAFTGGLLIERTGGGTSRRYLDAAALAGLSDPDFSQLIERVSAPRPPFGGLDMGATRLMGIVNVTPDSFSDGGLFETTKDALAHARDLQAEGADILDIGGESTRPGSDPVPLPLERARVLPVLEGLAGAGARLSVDTRKADMMRAGVAAGAAIVNDVSALTHDPDSLSVVAAGGASVILMHAKGDPKTMQEEPRYGDVVLEVYDALAERIAAAGAAGIPLERIAADPGIGFGKTFAHNLQIMQALGLFHGLGVALVVGASRKGFVGKITGVADAASRLPGSLAMALTAAARGVQILRVHDVAETVAALKAWRFAAGIEVLEGAEAELAL